MINKGQYHAVLGYVSMLIHNRQRLDEQEKAAAVYLTELGGKPGEGAFASRIYDFVGEATYNSGDDPEEVAQELLEAVGLEVEDA